MTDDSLIYTPPRLPYVYCVGVIVCHSSQRTQFQHSSRGRMNEAVLIPPLRYWLLTTGQVA